MQSDRVIGLDIVRATAIIMVVVFHSFPMLRPLTSIHTFGIYIHKLLSLSEPFGLLGVELFFVLSGFLIGTILIKMFIASEKFGLKDIKNFLVRRWFRTIPNYWLILIANILLYSYLNLNDFNFSRLSYFFFVQNLFSPGPLFFPESWSLAIEEWFYLSLPLIIFIFYSIFKKLSKQKIILLTFICYAVIPLSLRLASGTGVTDPLYFDTNIRKIVAYRLDAISYGLLMAYLLLYYRERVIKYKMLFVYISLSGIIAVTAIHFTGIYAAFDFYRKYPVFRLFINSFLLTLIPMFFSLCVPAALEYKRMKNALFSKIATFISKISYSVYLVHFSLLYLPFWEYRVFTVYNCIPFFVLYITVVVGLSYLIYNYFEYPIMNLRKKISKKDPAI